MKNKLIYDIFVYIISPILICNIVSNKTMYYIIMALIFSIFLYTFIINKKSCRINFTGIIFSTLYIVLSLLKRNLIYDFEKYVYDTYFLILVSISLLVLRLININIIKQMYSDILICIGKNNNYIYNKLKQKNIIEELEKTLQLIIINFMSISFIKVYSIATYGVIGYKTTLDLEVLICILFIIAEVYMIFRIKKISFSKSDKSSVIRIKSTKNLNKDNVIYLNKYKRTNK